jgi:hypothetical protein
MNSSWRVGWLTVLIVSKILYQFRIRIFFIFKSLSFAKMKRILVCGDRNWSDVERIRTVLNEFPTDSIIIHGGCRGADTIAGNVATALKMGVVVFHAEWNKHGLAAGPLRNTKMLDEGNPDIVIAFHPNISTSKGTKNMITQAKSRGIEVILYE